MRLVHYFVGSVVNTPSECNCAINTFHTQFRRIIWWYTSNGGKIGISISYLNIKNHCAKKDRGRMKTKSLKEIISS